MRQYRIVKAMSPFPSDMAKGDDIGIIEDLNRWIDSVKVPTVMKREDPAVKHIESLKVGDMYRLEVPAIWPERSDYYWITITETA